MKWEKVFFTEHAYKAQLNMEKLELENIPVVVLNQRDSSYNNFGMHVVMVPREYAQKAKELLSDLKN